MTDMTHHTMYVLDFQDSQVQLQERRVALWNKLPETVSYELVSAKDLEVEVEELGVSYTVQDEKKFQLLRLTIV